MAGRRASCPDTEVACTVNKHGVVIDELLCFVVNKIDLLPPETIVQLCTSTYSDVEIESAKRRLFDMCADENTSRRKCRKGPKKKEQNIEDIVKLMMEKGSDVPVFVAHDLSKLPLVTFDSMDVSTLLNNIKKTQDEVDMLKLCINTQNDTFEKLRSVVSAVDTRVRDLECRGQSPQREMVLSSDKDLTHPKEINPSPPMLLLYVELRQSPLLMTTLTVGGHLSTRQLIRN